MGLTANDLDILFPDVVQRAQFGNWLYGQTGGVCDGVIYRHERGPCFDPDPADPYNHDKAIPVPHHDRDEDHNIHCGYPGGGESLPSECDGNVHGYVVYRYDVDRYLASLARGGDGSDCAWD
jgi:hypothetical protein